MTMLTRRAVLRGGALSLALATTSERMAWAVASAPTDRRFVLVILRGAMDGLAAVPPYGDKDYKSQRQGLAIEQPGREGGALDLGGFYGLHPALKPIYPLFQSGELLIVHAVAGAYRGRSHFDAQDVLENGGAVAHGLSDGWLNRTIVALQSGRASDRPLGLATGQTVPLVMRGKAEVSSWAPETMQAANPDLLAQLTQLYQKDKLLSAALREGLAQQDFAAEDGMAEDATGDGAGKPLRGERAFGTIATTAGKMLAAPDGPRVATIEIGGWDTHVGQGTDAGRLGRQLGILASGLDQLRVALGEQWKKTAVMVATEFGRTVAPNGTGGTDHGTGGVALLMGGAVAGGKVAANWPGLSSAKLFEARDLQPTADLRGVAKAVLAQHLKLGADALDRAVFPDSAAAQPVSGLIRSA
jgi:uncharacterized protein (DUF1501 family)